MKLGRTQQMIIRRVTSVGAFVRSKEELEDPDILLPKKYLRAEWKVGDEISVFVSLDSEDRPVATTRIPKVEVGQMALLPVAAVTRIGAFVDWGLEKDLFLPFDEQLHRVKPNELVLVYCYLDKSARIACTMKVKHHFLKPEGLKENDRVEGVVYSTNPDIGAFILVEGKYNALLLKEEMPGALRVGQSLSLRIQHIKQDGKIDLSLHTRAHEKLDEDAARIYKMLEANHGFLRMNDQSSPEDIRLLFDISKAQFKRAVGRLLKNRQIRFEADGMKINKKEKTR